MMLIYINPDAANTLLRKCSDFITRYCMALKATGVNGVVMAEPAAGLLSNEDCLQYSSLFVKEIIEKVQDNHFAVVLHNCGNTGNCTQAMVYTGAAAYHFGNKIKMEEALKEVPADALAMGNLDPVSLFKMAGGYGVLFSLRAFSMALSMDLRYSRFSLVAPCAHTSLRCLS